MKKVCLNIRFFMLIFVVFVMSVTAQDDNDSWDFVYNGEILPQDIVDSGGDSWQPRPDEVNGRPKYEQILFVPGEAQIGGLWSRRDDNSEDPNAPGASSWARGYLFGTDIYDQWDGNMTLIVRINDLGTDSEKSVIDITNSAGDYFTLGHVSGVGWEFGQTEDGRNGNGLSDVQTGGIGRFVVIRIVVEDDTPGDGVSRVRGWQDGQLVYDSERGDDIAAGEFGEIAFRRTSTGNEQHMEIDWIRMEFGETWTPGEGLATPAGLADGQSPNARRFSSTQFVNGAIGMDSHGVIRTVRDISVGIDANPLFAVDPNGVPSQFNIFFLGFDAFRDLQTVADPFDRITGVIGLDKFAGVHTLQVDDSGNEFTGPDFNYVMDVVQFNANNPDRAVQLPYFPFEIPIDTPNDGVARDLEIAHDWRPATNAFQGYYILDAYAGVHYINNAPIMAMLQETGQNGINTFFDIFKFKPLYLNDFAGRDENDDVQTKSAPYFLFSGESGLPIAKDLEVNVRFEELTTPSIADSSDRAALAQSNGIDESALFQPIQIAADRLDISQPVFAPNVAITSGYSILDGFGGVHSMVEDADGNPIPAPWENEGTGFIDPSVDAPYFANPPFTDGDDFNIAIDFELMPNGQGYCLLTRLGEVFVVNAVGTTSADNFVTPGIEARLPIFGFDAARDLELVANDEGKIVGMYVVDRFGTVHRAGNVPRLPGQVLYFPLGFANELAVSPQGRPVSSPSD